MIYDYELVDIVAEAEERGYNKAIDECIKAINALNIEYAYPHTICNILEQLKAGASNGTDNQ